MKTLTPQILAMYLGCNCQRDHGKGIIETAPLMGVVQSEVDKGKWIACVDVGLDFFHEWYVEETKPILRRLEDMTDEERAAQVPTSDTIAGRAESIAYLLSKHFDLFGLIDAGLVIDAKTLQQEP